MKLYPRGRVWQVEFKDLNGARRQLSTGETDEKRARLKALDIVRDALMQTAPKDVKQAVANQRVTLDHVLERTWRELWCKQKSAHVRRHVLRVIQRDIGHYAVEAVTFTRLDEYCLILEERGLSAASRNRYMSMVSKALHMAARWEYIQVAPDVPHFKEAAIKERYVSEIEEARILEYFGSRICAAHPEWAFMRDLTVLLIDSGMRLTEALTVAELVGDRAVLAHGATKSEQARSVPLTRRAKAALEALRANPLHGTADADWCGRRWRPAMRALGIEGVGLHTLRHTCASRLVQRGVSLYRVQKWLGHSSIRVTERYAHLDPAALDDAVAVLERNDAPRLRAVK